MEQFDKQNFFDICIDAIKQRNNENYTVQNRFYEQLYDALNKIIENNFSALKQNLAIVPFGDYLINTYYDNSIVDFYIVYRISKNEIDFSVVDKKERKKGQKVSLYSQIMNSPVVSGTMQAEEIALLLKQYLETTLKMQKMFQKRNQIMIKLNDMTSARITICYDTNDDKGDFLVRKVNIWKHVNPMKFFDNFDKKDAETNHNFHKIIRLFKALEIELIIQNHSNLFIGRNYFVENLLYNVPSELFLGDNLEQISNVILAYLKLKDYKTFELIDETGKMIEQDFYSKKYEKQFINKIEFALKILPELLTVDDTTNE